MGLDSTLEPGAIRLQLRKYKVAPLNPLLRERVGELERGLRRGVQAYPDSQRRDFYDVKLTDGWAYIHVYQDARTVYLVSYFSSTSFDSIAIGGSLENEPRREC
jgi:hypothetical protein